MTINGILYDQDSLDRLGALSDHDLYQSMNSGFFYEEAIVPYKNGSGDLLLALAHEYMEESDRSNE